MKSKTYLQHNVIEKNGEVKNFFYMDIGLTLRGSNSYRLWISMYVQRDQQGEYISFPLKDAIITQGTKPSTLVMKHKRGYNIFNIILKDGYNYRLDSSDCNWKYYDKDNEGLLIVSTANEVSVYFEEKGNKGHKGTIKSNIYGFNEIEAINEAEGEIEPDKENVPIEEVINETLKEVANGKIK